MKGKLKAVRTIGITVSTSEQEGGEVVLAEAINILTEPLQKRKQEHCSV